MYQQRRGAQYFGGTVGNVSIVARLTPTESTLLSISFPHRVVALVVITT